MLGENQQYIRSMQLRRHEINDYEKYPFCLPAIHDLTELHFHPRVTFIVGENGTGKSTILEAIAVAWGFNPEGGTINFSFSSRASHSNLYEYVRLIKGVKKPRNGFFLRAESFYNLSTNIEELDAGSGGPSIISSYGGRSLHEQSHGEAFFATFNHRFGPQGLYILDEPEAALSPLRQMAIISRLHNLVQRNSQFIIATHSPILMAYPDAAILQFNQNGFTEVEYEQTDHFLIMKDFINNPQKMLKILMDSDC
ncbi:MAG TPA: AAA family ATPase [Methylomusa anaerophila]|uniref:Chromosome segregation protein n=1 Tax=Methylomusa anaerophila TaxID=1930071 RepID=A0A348AI13_9FIRM|nr:AAA family ATPase [Methylomusa anaerophila]BBB90711.1 chromosome segregation protein [Methylomusa anaerophila]HML88686.1 AAA family ATPase [Methylomusa anaerophila]